MSNSPTAAIPSFEKYCQVEKNVLRLLGWLFGARCDTDVIRAQRREKSVCGMIQKIN